MRQRERKTVQISVQEEVGRQERDEGREIAREREVFFTLFRLSRSHQHRRMMMMMMMTLMKSRYSQDKEGSMCVSYLLLHQEKKDDQPQKLSKKKLRRLNRISVAQLKQLVERPDLVEMHDVSAHDPKLLIQLKVCTCTCM